MNGLLELGKSNSKSNWFKRGAAILVIFAMVATCIQSGLLNNDAEVVNAAAEGTSIISLSAIEELKEAYTSSGDTYTILEVVPAEGTGSMGYWVAGLEPLTYYDETDGEVYFIEESGIATEEGSEARAEAAKTVTDQLEELGLLSEGTTEDGTLYESSTVLTKTDYVEYMVGIDDDIPEGLVIVNLVDEAGNSRTEQITYTTGAFEYKANSTGDFKIISDNVQLLEGGSHTQVIENFLIGTAADEAIATGADVFYYAPIFTEINFDELDDGVNSDMYAGRAIYELNEDGSTYIYLGNLGVDDFTLEIDSSKTYYWVLDDIDYTTIKTTLTADDTGYYLGIGDFVPVSGDEEGYFTAESSYEYVGPNNGNYSYNADIESTEESITVTYSSVYVNIGFTNNNWFRQYVLDDDTTDFADAFDIEVVEVLPTELTTAMIDDADLVVFSSGFSLSLTSAGENYVSLYTAENDISNSGDDRVYSYIQASISAGAHTEMQTPMIVEGNLLNNANTSTYVKNVAYQANIALYSDDDAAYAGTTTSWLQYANVNACGSAEGGLYYVSQGNAFVTRDITAEVEDTTNGTDFDYYSEVSATIAYENFLRRATGADEEIEGTAAEINIGTSIRHILMVGNQISATQKTEIRVLEIQPAVSSDDTRSTNTEVLDEEQVKEWFPGVETVTIDRMATSEFIGKIDDITEEYDVVYIGGDTGNLNTTTTNGNTTTVYNDSVMNGLLYTNIGDTYTINTSSYSYLYAGLLNSDYALDSSGLPVLVDGYEADGSAALANDIDSTYRLSGNDITTSKLDELINFVNIGLPVIISDELIDTNSTASNYDDDSISMSRVDKASYMYDFLEYAIGESNVFSVSELKENASTALQYLNLTKPEIVFSEGGTPEEYTGVGDLDDSLVDDNTVSYTFTIENDTDPTPEDTSYSVSLYIDQDADGTHEDNELISELIVTETITGTIVSYNELKSGTEYTVEKELPESYQGAIPWKLEVSIVGREDFHASETGYTYIKPSTIIEINILQIYETKTQLISENTYYSAYIDEMEDAGVYKLNITGITITDLNNNTMVYKDFAGNDVSVESVGDSAEEIYEYCLEQFDMLVLGFGDGYGITNDDGGLNAEAAEAVTMYIDSGKAVLFAHDTSSSNNVPTFSENTYYPMAEEIEESDSGYTIMKWIESDNQYTSVYGTPTWSIGSNRWDDGNYNEITITNNEVYNYEEEAWGWWVAPNISYNYGTKEFYVDSDYEYEVELTPTTYTAIVDASTAKGYAETAMPYWDATLNGGTWGFYAVDGGLTWNSVTTNNQPAEDVCYIYTINTTTGVGSWGWYQIADITGTEDVTTTTTTTTEVGMEWVSANTSLRTSNVYGRTSASNGKYTWTWMYYQNSSTYSLSNTGSYIYNFEEEEWGYWQAINASTTEFASTSYTVNTNNTGSGSYKIYPYYNEDDDKWGVTTATVTTSGSNKGVSTTFYSFSSQPADDVYYIYRDGSWGWYKLTGTTTTSTTTSTVETTGVPDKIEYNYSTSVDTKSISVKWGTSYYFNTIIRDVVGLDRYGITNEEYQSDFIYPYEFDEDGNFVFEDGLVANGYTYMDGTTISDEDVEELLDSGYSIAYQPSSDPDEWEYVEETQGYAIGDLMGRTSSTYNVVSNSSYVFWDRVTEVVQVNQGQITTYPYNVNTTDFYADSTYGDTFTVASTHHQYYQLNMNSEDVVVWYTLGGEVYDDYSIDVTNFYYIYNIGNVTYTGAGHSDAGATTISVAQEEAKLFINTMIAAYRAGRVVPDISFVDSDGTDIESMYFTVDAGSDSSSDTLLYNEGVASSEAELTFKITDTNLENPESRTIALTYEDGNENTITISEGITIYNSQGAVVANGDLESNVLYTLVIPDVLLSMLSDSSVNIVSMGITITTKFADGDPMVGDDEIDLYKLGLQNLN